jgi:hypothetical protein
MGDIVASDHDVSEHSVSSENHINRCPSAPKQNMICGARKGQPGMIRDEVVTPGAAAG